MYHDSLEYDSEPIYLTGAVYFPTAMFRQRYFVKKYIWDGYDIKARGFESLFLFSDHYNILRVYLDFHLCFTQHVPSIL